ncbi:helix-hairpin-helix domain-containing protein [Saliphagus sp. GCM10025334]|uniref:helix-hairpin-helix domain-containing protein n=1 Tax=Natronosalvus caseinilyticus TaxID=2953747 RepID=UPI0028AEC201|nr:helix-hairpin-helix domain-containing protein [Natronosalvus caseinilyticus]
MFELQNEIDTDELERRLEFDLDDRNDQIRAFVEDVNGVGPKTSKAIAREFASFEELRGADRERLESVHGVGEGTVEAVLKRIH